MRAAALGPRTITANVHRRMTASIPSRHPDVSASDLRNNVIGPKLALIDKQSPDLVVNNPTLPRGIGSYYPVQVTVSYNWTSIANFVPDMSAMTLRPLGPLHLTATSTKLIEGR